MKDRIKEIRTIMGLTQKEFAERLGLKQNTIASYEIGKIGVSDTVILSICREFEINENWLRTGNGKMRNILDPDDRYAHNLARLARCSDPTVIRWINAIAETPPQQLKDIEKLLGKIYAKK